MYVNPITLDFKCCIDMQRKYVKKIMYSHIYLKNIDNNRTIIMEDFMNLKYLTINDAYSIYDIFIILPLSYLYYSESSYEDIETKMYTWNWNNYTSEIITYETKIYTANPGIYMIKCLYKLKATTSFSHDLRADIKYDKIKDNDDSVYIPLLGGIVA